MMLLLIGCVALPGATPYQTFPGPRLAKTESAALRLDTGLILVGINGTKIDTPYANMRELLFRPGKYEFAVKFKTPDYHSTDEASVRKTLWPGKKYVLKVGLNTEKNKWSPHVLEVD